MENIKLVAEKLKEIEEFVKKNLSTHYDDVLEHVEYKLDAVKQIAQANHIPLIVTAEDIINKYREEEESSEYEEESSSYYYEEESSYYEE
jgi:hypothetical protein